MQLRELSKPITSKQLNESLEKNFGYKLKLEKFSDVQLEDVRNKLRTELSQFEVNESYNSVLESPTYQKTKALLDVVNQEIMEREEGKCPDCHHNPCDCDEEDTKEPTMKKNKNESKIYFTSLVQKAREQSIPDSWIKSAIERINLGESSQQELKAELVTRYDLHESVANHVVFLSESEQTKAEIIMATKDMVDRITGWLEDVAAMKAEQLLELMDSIREQLGSDVAAQYEQSVKPALENIYSSLESARSQLTSGLAIASGGEAPTMGAPAGGPIGGADLGAPAGGEMPPMGAPEGGDLGTPPAPEAGREKRESVEYSRRLGQILSSKKK
jgi:hypothetical protein